MIEDKPTYGELLKEVIVLKQKLKEKNEGLVSSSVEKGSLKNNKEKYKFLIENILDVVVLIDADSFKTTFISPSVEKLSGFTVEETHNQKIEDILPPKSLKYVQEKMSERLNLFIKTGKKENYADELEQYCKDGSTIWTEVLTYFRVNPENNKIEIIGTIRDITKRVKAEQEIKLLNQTLESKIKERTEELELSNNDLESFAYSVSHDLRAPLRHVAGFAKLLKSILHESNEVTEKYFEKINEASIKMSIMIDGLLKFSRLGRKSIEKIELDLNVLINKIIDEEKMDIMDRKIKFNIGKLPIVKGDYDLLNVVFENLISNAIKFTSKKDLSIIEIDQCKDSENECTVYIKDNGAGFDMAYSNKLFGVFQRLHTETEFQGIGIGLAHVSQIIKKHGGKIYAKAEIDKGATFYICL